MDPWGIPAKLACLILCKCIFYFLMVPLQEVQVGITDLNEIYEDNIIDTWKEHSKMPQSSSFKGT